MTETPEPPFADRCEHRYRRYPGAPWQRCTGPAGHDEGHIWGVPEPQGPTTSVEDLLLQWVNRTLTVEAATAIRDRAKAIEAEARAAAPPDIDVERLILELGDLTAHVGPDGTAAVYERDVIRTLRRLASPDATRQIDHRAMAQGVSEGTDQPMGWPDARRRNS